MRLTTAAFFAAENLTSLALPPSADSTTLQHPTVVSYNALQKQKKMTFYKVRIKLPGVSQPLLVSDVHQGRPLSFVAEAIRARRRLGVSSFVHLWYERSLHGHSGPEIAMQVVPLSLSTTVAQAYNLILQVNSFELSAVYVPTLEPT